jgi:hypothetical protein
MANKKEFTSEELAKACEEAKKNFEKLNEQYLKAKREEEEEKAAQLALEKEARKKEVDEAYDKYLELLSAYVKDYGSYSTTAYSDDWFPNKFWRSFF